MKTNEKLGKNGNGGVSLSPKAEMELTLVRTFCILSEIESLVVVIGKQAQKCAANVARRGPSPPRCSLPGAIFRKVEKGWKTRQNSSCFWKDKDAAELSSRLQPRSISSSHNGSPHLASTRNMKTFHVFQGKRKIVNICVCKSFFQLKNSFLLRNNLWTVSLVSKGKDELGTCILKVVNVI